MVIVGLLHGALLLWKPVPFGEQIYLWVVFPLFVVVGFRVYVIPASEAGANAGGIIFGVILLVFAGIAAWRLLGGGAPGSNASLWYVLGIGLVLGLYGVSVVIELVAAARKRRRWAP